MNLGASMRIESFNVENLLDRAKAFNQSKETAGTCWRTAELSGLFEHNSYAAARKRRMIELLIQLRLTKSDRRPFAQSRQIRERVLKLVQIVASGRDDWGGWVGAKTEPVDEISIDNTGQVIGDVNADVLAVMNEAFEGACVQNWDSLVQGVNNPDENRHVVAAVICGNARRDHRPRGDRSSHEFELRGVCRDPGRACSTISIRRAATVPNAVGQPNRRHQPPSATGSCASRMHELRAQGSAQVSRVLNAGAGRLEWIRNAIRSA